MDFIERIFQIAPDGGSGTLEALIIAAPFLVASLVVALRRRQRPATLR